MGDETVIQAANSIIEAAFKDEIGNALDGLKIEYVPDFKQYGELPMVNTYGKMAVCTQAELPDACATLGKSAASTLRSLIDKLGMPAKVVTFLKDTPCPRIDAINRDGDKMELRGYFDVGVSG